MTAFSDINKIAPAVEKAGAYLRVRLRSGSYGLACVADDGTRGFSDDKGHVFVASFVVEALTGLIDELDRTIVLVRILSEETEPGAWGYSPPGLRHKDDARVFHLDSDDTAYAIRTLQRLGVNRPPESLMRYYRRPERLFTTFDAPGPVSLTTEASPRNNLQAHLEVNTNIFLALQPTHLDSLINYDILLDAQDEFGMWKSYFYPSALFGTLLVLDATRGNPDFSIPTRRALLHIAESQNSDGSWGVGGDPLETALAVAALAGRDAGDAAMHRGVEHLLSTMAGDGSWASSACLWKFHATEHDVLRAFDEHRAYITARCLIALRRSVGELMPSCR